MPEDPRLRRLSVLCAAFPEAQRRLEGEHARFLVGRKTFAWFLSNHHGDGIVSVSCKALPGENNLLAAGSTNKCEPSRFYLPTYLGSRGWIALRLDVGKVDWDEVRELLQVSYLQIAPKRLASRINEAIRARDDESDSVG